ncbi:hypothetical protein N7492_010691 [Penicillium capsulatum]|uniref:Mid2 domain-containing protein n=1 Tax=Penicillium capsulatum TaxID=69766 RepID=A0A9W9HMU9_9EURO|nr:hypothetical protein N7492_010691 [Penicillium capsulatum]KAJ6103532.1 hypothetical protein N7512_010612 [Penicillium capsulatum]KAJ6113189.1 hypothetical protein N7512_008513 [Penicillium capsulatum]
MDLLLYIFALLPLVQAWTFRYTNSANETTTLHGTKNLDCTDIDLPNRNVASYDPEGTLPCLLIYQGAKCPDSEHDDVNATSCESWKWTSPANGHFRGIKVLVSGAPTATASISIATQTTATTATSTSPSTSSDSSSGLSLSGGAIAGIVVGLVCAFLIFAAIFFFLGRRKRKAILANQQNAPQGPCEPSATGDAEADVLTSAKGMSEKPADLHPAGVGLAPGSQLAELAASGQNRPAELATNPVHELDTHNER